MRNKLTFQIEGMSCASCKTLIESDVNDQPGINNVNVNFQTGECKIDFDDQKTSQKKIFATIKVLNYKVKTDKA